MSDEINQPTTTEAPAAPASAHPEESIAASGMWDTMDKAAAAIAAREPVHGPDGKFQPKIAAEGADGTEVPGSPQAAPPDPAPPVIEAPQSLPADVKAKWSTLPPETQRWLADRESEVHKKFTADGERLKALTPYEELAGSLADRLKQVGAPAPEYFRRLAAADELLFRDGPAGLRQIAELYRIDPNVAFGAQPPGQQQQAQPDPNSALARKLSQVESQLNELTQSAEQAKIGAAQQIIDDFKKDKPHFDAVEPLIVTLMEGNAAKDMAAAYAMAIKAHPEVSALIEAEAKTAAEKKAVEDAKAKAEKDRKLGTQSRRPGTTPTAPSKAKSWQETVDRVASEVAARS